MISIIIPTLNEEKLVGEHLSQYSPDIIREYDLELIISDGGSSDETLGIAERFPVRIVRYAGDRRQTIAEGRNAGAAVAGGEILIFMNCDTRFHDVTAFFQAVTGAMRDRSIAAATCAVHVFPEEERGIDRWFHFVHNGYCRFLNLIGEGMGRGECQIVRSDLFRRLGGYNSSMPAGEDYELFRRIRRIGRILFLPRIVIYESPRRFRKYGYFHIVWGWTRNALSVVWRKKSSSEVWEAVR